MTAALHRILKNKQVHIDAKNIAERRRRHTLASEPIKAFTEQAIPEDSADNDRVREEDLYKAYTSSSASITGSTSKPMRRSAQR